MQVQVLPSGLDIAMDAGLWFAYGKSRREGVTATTTFDAVMRGERTSTTRFVVWPGHEAWKRVCPGMLVRFNDRKDRRGRDLVVKVSAVSMLDLRHCSDPELEAWSACEGWCPAKGRELGLELGPAIWLRHELVWPAMQPIPPPSPTQGSLF